MPKGYNVQTGKTTYYETSKPITKTTKTYNVQTGVTTYSTSTQPTQQPVTPPVSPPKFTTAQAAYEAQGFTPSVPPVVKPKKEVFTTAQKAYEAQGQGFTPSVSKKESVFTTHKKAVQEKDGFTPYTPTRLLTPAEKIIERGKGYQILGKAAALERKGKIIEAEKKFQELKKVPEEVFPKEIDLGTGLRTIPKRPPEPKSMEDVSLPSIKAYKEPTQKELTERKELLKKEFEVDIGKESVGGFLEYGGVTAIFAGAEAAYTGGASLPTAPAVIIGGAIAGGILRPLGEITEKEYLKAVKPKEAEFIYGGDPFYELVSKPLQPAFYEYKQFTERHIGVPLTEEQRGEYLGLGVEVAGIGGLMLAPRVARKATAKIGEKLPKLTEKIESKLLKEAPHYKFLSEPSRMPVKIEPYSDPLYFVTKPTGIIEETKIYRILGRDVPKTKKFIYSLKGKGITSPTKKAEEVFDPYEKKLIQEVELIPQQPLIAGTAERAAIAKQEYIPQTTNFMGKVKVTPENFLNKIVVEGGKPRMVSRLFEGKPSVLKPKPREMYVGGMEVSKVTKPAKQVLSYELPKEQYLELVGQKGALRLRTGEEFIGVGEFERSLKQRIIPRPKGIRFKGEARTGLKVDVFKEEDLSKAFFTMEAPESKAVIKGYAETSKDFMKKFPKAKQGSKDLQKGMRQYQASILRQNLAKDFQRDLSELGFKTDIAGKIRTGKIKTVGVKAKTVTTKAVTPSFFVQPLRRMKPPRFEVYEETLFAPLILERGVSSKLFQPLMEAKESKIFQPTKLRELQGEKLKPVQMAELKVRTDLLPKEKISEVASMKTIQAERIIPREAITPRQSIKTIQGSLEKMFTPQATKTTLGTPVPKFTPFPPPPPPPLLLFGLPSFKSMLTKKRMTAKGQAFNVFARKDATKMGRRLIKLNKKPLTEESAKGMGAEAVDETVSKTFKIQKTKGTPRQKNEFLWGSLSYKFRPKIRKGKPVEKGRVFVEKNAFGIDTFGELQGITVKGWKAIQRKKRRLF